MISSPVRYTILFAMFLTGAVLRLYPGAMPYCELDGAVYLRTSAEIAEAFGNGSLWYQPFCGDYYSSVDYWPPLFPLLAAFLGGPYALSAWAGALAFLPVYALAKALFAEAEWLCLADRASRVSEKPELPDAGGHDAWAERSALVAAACVAWHPYLAWLGRVPRSETLYILLAALALFCLLPAKHGRFCWLAGGISLGLAYTVRFDGLFMAPAAALAVAYLRGRRAVFWMLVGLVLGAAPYLAYLAWLNGGSPSLIPPKKVIYDALEGVYTQAHNCSLFDFSCQYGLPGLSSLRGSKEEFQQLLSAQTLSVMGLGVKRLPANLLEGTIVWGWLAWPLLLSCRYASDRRWRALLLCCLPVLGMAMFMSWDVSPRYYAFSLVPLSCLAAKGLEGLARWPEPGLRWRWICGAAVCPLWLTLVWPIPRPLHFDQHGPVDTAYWELLPQAENLRLLAIASGIGLAAVLSWRGRKALAGLAGTALAVCLAGGPVLSAAEGAVSSFQLALPAALLGLLMCPAVLYATLPKRCWGAGMWAWVAMVWTIISWGSLITLESWSAAHGRILCSAACADYLGQRVYARSAWAVPLGARAGFGNSGPRVMALQQIDAVRSGARWLPWDPRASVASVLRREQPDFVIAAFPDPLRHDDRSVVVVPELQASGGLKLTASFLVPGGGAVQRQWRVYTYKMTPAP